MATLGSLAPPALGALGSPCTPPRRIEAKEAESPVSIVVADDYIEALEQSGRKKLCEVLCKASSECSEDAEVATTRLQFNIKTSEAQYRLGSLYEDGVEMGRDVQRAAALFESAAKLGHRQARCALGECYETGQGKRCCLEKACFWYDLAAAEGDAHAQCNLARLHEEGVYGVLPRCLATAGKYYALAAKQGLPIAQEKLCLLSYELEEKMEYSSSPSSLVMKKLEESSGACSSYINTNDSKNDYCCCDDDSTVSISPGQEEDEEQVALEAEEKARATMAVWHVAAAIAKTRAKEARRKSMTRLSVSSSVSSISSEFLTT